MGKRRWKIRGLQALLLLVTLCLILRASAKSASPAPSPKAKVSTAAKTHGALPPRTAKSRPARQPTKTVAARKKGPAVAKTVPQGVAKTSAKKHKRNVKTAVSAKLSPRAKSRTTAKSVTRATRRHGQRKTVTSVSPKAAPDAYSEPAEHPFLEDDQAAPGSSFFSSETAPFPVQLNDERLPYRINSVFALPAERFILEVGEAGGKNQYLLQVTSEVSQTGLNTWTWQAPRRAGLYPVTILHPTEGATIILNVFVMVPFSQLAGGYVNGYRIGNYPRSPFKLLPIYHLPRGFIEVTPANENV
ncbi:MAG TPA: hypothetical protein VGX03_12895, partial [Candidatus Binatia bacterium]|nr:hypothetical protein [Candidatus Binatia bacterium]